MKIRWLPVAFDDVVKDDVVRIELVTGKVERGVATGCPDKDNDGMYCLNIRDRHRKLSFRTSRIKSIYRLDPDYVG